MGEDVVVVVVIDPDTNRIIASTMLKKHMSLEAPRYPEGAPVDMLIYAETELGYNAVVNNAHRGLIYRTNLAGPLKIGARMNGFVKSVREDGKIDLSIDAAGYSRVRPLSEMILAELERAGGRLNFDDSSDPEAIRERFGVSKKAFKQAIGALYRDRRILLLDPGIQLVVTPPSRGGRR
jgi:predicted RNA-binding protein (virulence factor B family)